MWDCILKKLLNFAQCKFWEHGHDLLGAKQQARDCWSYKQQTSAGVSSANENNYFNWALLWDTNSDETYMLQGIVADDEDFAVRTGQSNAGVDQPRMVRICDGLLLCGLVLLVI